jgi:leader peptidase (prepilin peptidase)/N-methyltransferase
MIAMFSLLFFLSAASLCDLKSHRIPVYLPALSGSAGIMIFLLSHSMTLLDEVLGIILGAAFVSISLISEGKFGLGDGLAILIAGIHLGGREAGFTCLYAMLLSAMFSVALLLIQRCSKNKEVPFVPFLLAGLILHEATVFV